MPCLVIKTNAKLTKEQLDAATADLSKIISKTTGKPEDYIMVCIEDGLAMRFANSDEKCIFMEFRSIGKIDAKTNKTHSKEFTNYFVSKLGFNAERIYISFENKAGSDWGYAGSTFG